MNKAVDGNVMTKRDLPKGIYNIDGKFRATVWDANAKTYQVGTYETAGEAKVNRDIVFIKQHLKDMEEYVSKIEKLIGDLNG